MRVCRSWRATVLSGPSLWSTFAFSLRGPSVRTLEALKRLIDLHILRSQSTPLSFFVELLGASDQSITDQIIDILVGQQQRWKRAHLRMYPVFVTHLHLNVEDLCLLEELGMRYRTAFRPSISTISGPQPRVLSSLRRLELGIPWSDIDSEYLRWLQLAPNVEELCVMHTETHVSFKKQYPCLDAPIVLPNLRILQAGIEVINTYPKKPISASLLRFITCPALVELRVCCNNRAEDALCTFFTRSAPPLRVFSVDINAEIDFFWREESYITFLAALALVPTVTDFRVEWYSRLCVDMRTRELARKEDYPGSAGAASFATLPMLERLEIFHIDYRDSHSEYVEFLRARWRARPRTLKAVKILGARRFSPPLDELPAVRLFVSEGLQFEVPDYFGVL